MASKKPETKGKKKATVKKSPSSSKKNANITKIKSGYQVRVSVDGKRVTRNVRTKKEALKVRTSLKSKQAKVIPVRKVVNISTGKPKKVTKKAIKEKKVRTVNPRTGRKQVVPEVKTVNELPLTEPQKERRKSDKAFHLDLMDGRVVPAMMALSTDQSTDIRVRFAGQEVICNSDQLSDLINRLSSSYHEYAEQKKIPSPVIRWRMDIDPNESTDLNLDKSFFGGEEDEPFDMGFDFFDWSNEI